MVSKTKSTLYCQVKKVNAISKRAVATAQYYFQNKLSTSVANIN